MSEIFFLKRSKTPPGISKRRNRKYYKNLDNAFINIKINLINFIKKSMQTNTDRSSIPAGQNIQAEEFKTTEQYTNIPLQEEPKTNKKKLLIPIVVLLVLLLMGATAYATNYFISLNNSQGNLENESEKLLPDQKVEKIQKIELEKEEETVTKSSEYTGKYIKAEIPDGWKIVEHENGEGTDLLMLGVAYTGLTGIAIFTDLNEKIFTLQAADGLGGMMFCIPEVQFPDTPGSYVEDLVLVLENFYAETGGRADESVIPKINEGEYTEFALFEHRGRRIGTNLYWNAEENTNSDEFHTHCPFPGVDGHYLDFRTVSFDYKDNSTNIMPSPYTYNVKILGTPKEDDLLILDSILSSIALK